MDKRTFVGLCAALAFAAGSPAVHALKIVDAATDDPATADTARASNTYAKEMLLSANTTGATATSDKTTYYDIAEENVFLSAPADVGANPGDTYIVIYTLDGMVFQEPPSIEAPTGFSVASGGMAGDKVVVFRMSSTAAAVTASTLIVLNAQFAISAAGNGSVTRTVTNQTLAELGTAGVTGSMTHTASGAIKLASGFKETAMPMTATATVEHSFRSFNGAAVAAVGSLRVTHNGDVRQNNAAGDAVSALTEIITPGTGTGAGTSTVQIMGDFSFATSAFLHGDDDCSAEGTDTEAPPTDSGILKMEGTGDDAMVVGVNAVNVTEFDRGDPAGPAYLCIMVDPEDEDGMRIPETVAYTAMGAYTGAVAGAAFDPAPMEQTLGMIRRDGTTAHIPYMTTYEGYNQRIVLSNRSSVDADYEMTFRTEEGVMAEASDMATGTLMGNTTVTYKATDLVTLTEGSRAAATIILEAQPGHIDVTSVIVNKESRDTDTVVHH